MSLVEPLIYASLERRVSFVGMEPKERLIEMLSLRLRADYAPKFWGF